MNQTLEILKHRHHSGSEPGKRDDPYKIALCVEGGGLRGVVSGGALASLEALGYKKAFDVLYGASSGAYSTSFFASGNTVVGARFYLDYAQKQFISLKRLLQGGSLFDLDYVEQIMHSHTPLNYKVAIKSKPPLHVVASDAQHDQPVTIKNFADAYDLDRALHASATFPPFKKPRPLIFRRRRYLDAAILDPFCLHSAVKEGATHIVVLFSMPIRRRRAPGFIDKELVGHYFNKINPNLGETFLHHGEYSISGLSHVWNHYDGTHILAVAPRRGSKLPGQLTRNRKKLGAGFKAGARAILDHLAPDNETKEKILASFKNELHI